jgi:hypothetical protein
LLALRGEGFGSPSTWFGVASLIAYLVLVVCISSTTPSFRQLLLIAFSVATVAFSKGIFVYATALIAVSFSLFNLKTLWKVAFVASITTVGSVAWFSWASISVDEFVFGFWPYRNWQSQFAFDFYTLRVFFEQLINPVILGITCAVILQRSKHVILRQINLSLICILVAAVASQLVITSSGARSFELFYVPGVFAAAVFFLVLAVSTSYFPSSIFWQLVVVFALALGIVKFSPILGSGTINPFSIATMLIGAFFGVTWLVDKFGLVGTWFRSKSSIPLVSVFLILVATMTFVFQDFPDFPLYSRTPVNVQTSNWFGSPDFIELADFIREETSSASLLALSICNPNADQSCEPDFRPAALTGRRFLALDPLFFEEAVDDRTWADVELSRAIGVRPSTGVIEDLAIRGVNYVLIDRSRVKNDWVQNAKDAGAADVFSNNSYFVLLLRTNRGGL